jgi:hypothetical protein
MQERSRARVSPRSAVTAAIEEVDRPLAFGIVANISDTGACICTDGMFPVGDSVVVQLSFRGEAQPMSVQGCIVWCGHDADHTFRYGVQWIQVAGGRLRRLIRDC